MLSTGARQVVSELLPELIELFPGQWTIEDSHHCTVASSDNIEDTNHGIWRHWTRDLSDGRSVTWFVQDFV